MNKIILWALAVVLVFSLGGVGYFALEASKQKAVISELHQDLKEVDGKLSAKEKELTETEKQLSQVKADLTDSKAELAKGQKIMSDLRKQNDALRRQLIQWNAVKCNTPIPYEEVNSISTNQGLIELITKTAEDDMGFSSVRTSFEVLWNNSKTAIFTIVDQERATVKIAVVWDFNTGEVIGIYNLNWACVYYPN